MSPAIVFVCFVAFFHLSEFALAVLYNWEDVGLHSWLVSKPYCAALALGALERCLEDKWLPQLTQRCGGAAFSAGLAMLVAGECLRKAAMLTAGASFTHRIKDHRRDNHVLVTGGVYSVCRHPGYLGWFIWSVGGQLLLCNPLCTAAFAYVASVFFRERVEYEEACLVQLFGDRFVDYASRTPIWIPGVRGFVPFKSRAAARTAAVA